MRLEQTAVLIVALVLGVFTPAAVPAAEQEGVAVAIVFDTSGSMNESVRNKAGVMEPKYRIATRSLQAVANKLEAYATNRASGPRNVQAGLFVFTSNNAREEVKLGPLNAEALRRWAERFHSPKNGTPLGAALVTASRALLKSGLSHKHLLVITDGINTVGRDPAAVMPGLIKQSQQAGTTLGFHFVAFDVDASVFAPVKKLGGTVVGAADEKQLNTQIDYILQQKILLEDEEPAKK